MMGDRETLCQLCGYTFVIARLRRADEPEEAAWDLYGADFVNVNDEFEGLCGEGSGCTMPDQDGRRAGEHIAGPNCVSDSGYSGHQLSMAEIKGYRAVQCLVKKGADWVPENGDQDFEIEGEYFLTGIGDASPGEALLDNIVPVRYGISSINIFNLVPLLIRVVIPFKPD